MANEEHLERLRQGVDVWNDWRTKEPSVDPDLSGASLSAADLSGADLGEADLHSADLRKAILCGADLSGASLFKANLSQADLGKADLSEADLNGADLRLANLRGAKLGKANLSYADLGGADLSEADFSRAYLEHANLSTANLGRANLTTANLCWANLYGANLTGGNLSQADLGEANLSDANLSGADLSGAALVKTNLSEANLTRANLRSANLNEASFRAADLRGANLRAANLGEANLRYSNLQRADLSKASLHGALLVETNLVDAVLTGCRIYGISAWNVELSEGTKQQDLVITAEGEPEVTVDNIEVAQFVYLLLYNEKIHDIIDTIGRKGVLLLGRFTEGRIAVLDRLRDELRKRGFVPIVFNFNKPETKNFTETVRLLAGLSHFVIADVTNPKSAPLELQATVPECMIPFRPIIEEGEKPFSMLEDLWIQHRDWVFEPIYYSSLDALVGALDEKIIKPAEIRFAELLARKAETMKGEHV